MHGRTRAGAPLWAEVAGRLALTTLESDPLRCAEQVSSAAVAGRAVIVAPLPAAGTWDRSVAADLAIVSNMPLTVLVTDASDPAKDIRGERFDVGPTLDGAERLRWWSAVCEDADAHVGSRELTELEAWWENARRAPAARAKATSDTPEAARTLFAALALAARPWPESDVTAFGADETVTEALVAVRAVQLERGWLVIDPAWEERAGQTAASAPRALCESVAAALASRFRDEPWAHARAAELLLRANACDEADREHATAIGRAADALARREIVSRWMQAVDLLAQSDQLPLRMRAAERALGVGEADEAYRWAQSASSIAPLDPDVTLLVGRAAVALGDLVAAKVALERGRASTSDPRILGLIAVELAEVAYLGGDLGVAETEVRTALGASPDISTMLRARNTIGKILLADAKYTEADMHFAEDAQLASSHGDTTAELRARLNRGIALLSKGLVDEARSIFESVLSEGERIGDARACAFALDNLAVVATWRHEYATALALSERTLKLRQRLGDRLTMARILANLAELRRKLGLIDHAEHAIAFGRRTLGPGMPPAHSAHFSRVAARLALARGHTIEARREIANAIVDGESAGKREFLGEAYRIATRIALEDGDLGRVREMLARARDLATTEEAQSEVALLTAQQARASGDDAERLALEALMLARSTGEEENLREAHVLLAEIDRAAGNLEGARLHVDQAIQLRDRVADGLPDDVRVAFLARSDVQALARLQASLAEPEPATASAGAPTQRSSSNRPSSGPPREIVGDDPAMRGLLSAVKKVSRSNSTVLIRGESGTGKELVAEALHRASERANGPMVTVNCAALVETLLLSELFGHEKGAFTGAFARRRGRFELAEGGTLFLDEIGDISPKTQVALLRVLQERTFERVGGTTPIRVNVRIICATHRDLRAMVERGEFREDLYYRLRGITLEVPSLRARMGDLPRIAEHLLGRIAVERGEPAKSLTGDALDLLGRHKWPGNVRELENALRAASLFAESDRITAAHLLDNVDDLRAVSVRASDRPPPLSTLAAGEPAADAGDEDSRPLPAGEANATAVAYSQVRQGSVSLSDMKRQIERDCIARALAETKGNITRAASLLGMKRPRLSQLVKQYGLAAVSSEESGK